MTRRLRPRQQSTTGRKDGDAAAAEEDAPFIEPVYDPCIHLQLETPRELQTLQFETVSLHPGSSPADFAAPNPLPEPSQDDATAKPSSLAYTTCFRVLSDEGIRVLRGIISSHGGLAQSNARIPCMIRNLGYVSPWIRAFNECPVLLSHLGKLAGLHLQPTYQHGSYSHVNFGVLPPGGEIGAEGTADAAASAAPALVDGESDEQRARRLQVPVDQWHADSVPFVLIIILSEMQGMVGGELECVRRKGREEGMKLIAETHNRVPESELLRVSYERMGYALFQQGCDIVHHVTPVLRAREPRITVVNSYMPRSAFVADRHVYSSFAPSNDPTDFSIREGAFEFARGRAVRHAAQLDHFARQPIYEEDPQLLADQLEKIAQELVVTIGSLRKKPPAMPFYDERGGSNGNKKN